MYAKKRSDNSKLGSKTSKFSRIGSKVFDMATPLVLASAPYLSKHPIGRGILNAAGFIGLARKANEKYNETKEDLQEINDIYTGRDIERDRPPPPEEYINPF